MLTSVAFAQERCASDILEKKALQKNPELRSQFESWMKKKIAARKAIDQTRSKTSAVYQIPVVVHILHNGEAVNSGLNIPDAQVISQIRVLNEDYQRMNADASTTPAEFQPVASSIDLEFVLAKQDPDGLPTSGITRTLANKSGYTSNDDAEIKSQIYWPAEDYLNIWVTNLTDTYLGFAQYPITDLQGTQPPYEALTDGVVIHYKAFGSLDDGAFNLVSKYNKGRTTTHEVGHYLGLLHVFGDFNGCGTTDYVDDTPVQSERTFTCPSGPLTQCGHHVMYQNFLDYTDDACMNLFTAGQIARIQAVLDNSIRRHSLLTSHGLVEPVVFNLDLEAKNIAAPFDTTCGQSIVPRVVIRNRGNQPVTSAKISFSVNGNILETKTVSLNLDAIEEATISFTTIDLPEPSSNDILFKIIEVNGTADDQTSNDQAFVKTIVQSKISAPILEPFNSKPDDWRVLNPDSSISWTIATAPRSPAPNTAAYIDFYDYQTNAAKDQLLSPFISIPNTNALLKFDHAYAMFPGTTTERLRILITTGCSTDFSEAVEIYNKSGEDLATAPAQSSPFVPTGETQWGSDGISLSSYAGQIVQLFFEATNNNGNNLYVDNVQISTGDINDLKISSVVAPGPVFCQGKAHPVIEVQNLGSDIVSELKVITEVNGIVNASETFADLAMAPGDQLMLTLAQLNLSQSTNKIRFTISDPDALGDDTPADNTTTITRIFNTVRDQIPLRQNFDEGVTSWTIFTDGDQMPWSGVSTNVYKNSLFYNSFSDTNAGDQSWLVSPVLNLSNISEGSLFFTTSYGRRPPANESLKVLVSEDCGVTYDRLLFEKSGEDLSNEESTAEWIPGDSSEWRTEYLSINDFAGKDNVRFAFVATNANGNNLYLDNIEFFVEDNPEPPRPRELFSVYNSATNPYEFFITFNLPEKQEARLVVYNALGQLLIDSQLPNALNQTYTVNLYGQSPGVYIARLLTPSMTSSSKLFVGK